jgi:hypothetical protein
MAKHPLPFDLFPGATHWFQGDSDIECRTIWKNHVISSDTQLLLPADSGLLEDVRTSASKGR